MSIVSCGVCGKGCLSGSMYVCGECATKASCTQPTSTNSTMPKLPGIFNVETHVLNIHHDCSINERERVAGIVCEVYDYIAEQLRQ